MDEVMNWSLLFVFFLCFPAKVSSTAQRVIYSLEESEIVRCRGMPCEEWDAIQEELRQFKGAVSNSSNDNSIATESDIWLSLEDIREWEDTMKTRRKRKLDTFSEITARWNLPLFYYIDSDFDAKQTERIRRAIDHWQQKTCIRFTRLTLKEALSHLETKKSFVYFVRKQKCGSFIGHIMQAVAQQVYLADACIRQWGAVVHEIGHVLGFWHEHQRSDRDDYVTIYTDRMTVGVDMMQLTKADTRNLVPYDYGSIMHYWAWTESNPTGSVTIKPKDSRYLYTLGQHIGLSFLDVKLANIEYCSGRCANAVICQNQGYQNPDNCFKCICPDGFCGSYCEKLAPPSKDECGGIIDLDGDQKVYISSPGYENGDIYSDYTSCSWIINAPVGHNVNLIVMDDPSDHFGLYCVSPVCTHWLEIKMASSDMSVTGPRFCCKKLNGRRVLPDAMMSDGTRMVVLMRTNLKTSTEGETRLKQGFRALLWASKEKLSTRNGYLMTNNPTDNTIMTMLVSNKILTPSTGRMTERGEESTPSDTGTMVTSLKATQMLTQAVFSNTQPAESTMEKPAPENRLITATERTEMERRPLITILNAKTVTETVVKTTSGRKPLTVSELLINRKILVTTEQLLNQRTTLATDATRMTTDRMPAITSSEGEVQTTSLSDDRFTPGVPPVTSEKLLSRLTAANETEAYETTDRLRTSERTVPAGQPHRQAFVWRCGFESSQTPFCDMTQERSRDQFDWTRQTGPTASAETGPDWAVEGKYYIYIEASRPRKLNDTATIFTPFVPKDGQYCLQFSYSMHGFHIKELRVHVHTRRNDVTILRLHREKVAEITSKWQEKSLLVDLSTGSMIGFTGERGSEYSGDIALDDISLSEGLCRP